MKNKCIFYIRGILCSLLFANCVVAQIPIKQFYHGQNAAMVYQIGSTVLNGQFDVSGQPTAGNVKKWPEVAQAGTQSIRFGGIAVDQNASFATVAADYVHIVQDAYANGIEPILQVSFPFFGSSTIPTVAQINSAANDAADIVDYINNTTFPQHKVTYWIIGNEPNGSPHDFQLLPNNDDEAKLICAYIQAFSKAMKAKDAGIQIIGPELTGYDNFTATSNNTADHLIDQLCDVSNSATNITGYDASTGLPYIDIFSIHGYPFKNMFTTTPTAGTVNGNLRGTNGYDSRLTTLWGIINSAAVNATTNRGPNNLPLKLAVTEFNICYENKTEYTDNNTTKLNGVDANSFLGGQYWAEMAGIGMEQKLEFLNFFSVVEGSDSYNNDRTNIGYLDQHSGNMKKPTYWHLWLVDNNFRGDYYAPAVVTNGTGFKSYAAKSGDRVAVIIMNQNTSGTTPFKVRLDNSTAVGTDLDIQYNITGVTAGSNHVSTFDIEHQSTVVLIFDCKGAISGRYDYKLSGALAAPTTYTPTYTSLGAGLIGSTISNNIGGSQLCSSGGNCQSFQYTPSNYTYVWSSTSGSVTYSGNSVTLCALVSGGQTTYTFVATDPSSGCTTSQQVIVNDCGPIVGFGFEAYVCAVTPSNCGASNGSATACGSGGSSFKSFKWDNATNFSNNATATGLAPGTHTVVVKDAPAAYPGPTITRHCYVGIAPGTQPAISAGADKIVNKYCKVTLTASPNMTSSGYTYKWYKGNSTTPFSTNYTTTFTVWSNETYKVVVTTPSGCYNSDNVNVYTKYPRCFPAGNIYSALDCPTPPVTGKTIAPAMNTISSPVTINSDQVIDNVIKVTNNGVLTISDCELALTQGSKIIVEPGGRLVISNAFIHGCGFIFWEGISVKGNNNVSNQLSISGSVVRDAKVLIDVDKTVGVSLSDNFFTNGLTGLHLDRSNDFSISRNYFADLDVGISTMRSPISNIRSLIKENIFKNVKTAIQFDSDNHSKLDVLCNTFDSYTDYAIYSNNTVLQDQGSLSQGAGNTFISASTKVNDKLRHQGNTMKYYYDPSAPISLTAGGGMTAQALAAGADGSCVSSSSARTTNPNGEASSVIGEVNGMMLSPVPNPNAGTASIFFSLGDSYTGEMTIMDTQGRVIGKHRVDSSTNRLKVDYTGYAEGIYFITLVNSKGETTNKKMMISR